MSNIELLEKTLPVAPLKLVAMESCSELGQKVNDHIVSFRKNTINEVSESPLYVNYRSKNYLVDCCCPRFGSGEGKGILKESIRGTDLFIMTDVCNHSLTYTVNGHPNHMSPDDHFQDLKRIISAATGKAHRITVIMPFLYESRQHKRTKRESLDCALALEELASMGIANIITFDAHDPRVQNAIPLNGFDSFNPLYQFMKALFREVPDLAVDKDHLMVISPDEGAMHRAVYFSNMLGVDMGMFYKRRDYSKIINGKNPIVAHEFLGDDVKDKDVIIIDDMISSGESMLDVAKQLKERKAKRVIACTTFGLFTDGFEKFDEYYENGYLNKVITTNLTYLPPEAKEKPYFIMADLSKYLAIIIDSLNHDTAIGSVMTPTEKIHALLERRMKAES
ncbi:ribose-phosphate pyrophosphokinase [Schaedlerella arabinosiphila]|jgi:ribose-phosphate pyrophosphokinase|uniref:ribose-phosphate diphosphokinase n=1 Tax=Schaedlerella arabinosiphila TaxID=2044587 RepID=N2B311_9FIRM|nr:ribose-phosphate pyrophosphokinase [Schaedlerella arabinosiphila]KAI4439216.1 Ribose-phosphate pyrophosphokinase [Schaedlerella arabinosiphila]MCI9634391.1 ribose-phosphate pyrophosphokinase [Ruminococcus sp.]NDO67599.1 ribose-phosphate pyrophosphokinase [Schaedlerella arabinosiphila]RRK30928.1 ribose-phosphate pyrophosphokinase [Schaedlerella arabinosiphila]